MGKNATIGEHELPPEEPIKSQLLAKELAAEAAALPRNAGRPSDLSEYGWSGGYQDRKRRLTPEQVTQWLNADLGPRSALEEILLAVIERHPDVPVENNNRNVKSDAEYRLEQAMRILIGKTAPKGRRSNVSEEDLEKVAREYFRSVVDLGEVDDDHMQNVILRARGIPREGLDSAQIEAATGPFRRAFEEQFQRLMFKVVYSDSDEQLERRGQIERTKKLVLELDVTSAPPNRKRLSTSPPE